MRAPITDRPATRDNFPVSVLIGAVISAAISWTLLKDVWATGVFFDTDDATRMAQVRDWMAGQAWYDLQMHRLGLPGAEPMHWTRIVDVPVALLVKAAALFLDPTMAERAARIAFPFLLSLGVIAVGALIAVELVGGAHVMTACLVIALTGLSMLQFQPGRIDHHAPQILLLLMSGLFLLRSIRDMGRSAGRTGFLSAACLAGSLAISLENLPAACVIATCFACLWATCGKTRATALNGFSWGLILMTPLLYAATMAPARWFVPACDAQSLVHVALAMSGGVACLGLTRLGRRLGSPRARWGWLAMTAIALAGVLRMAFPHCGLDPYADVDPLVRVDWLDKVKEAFSLHKAWSLGLTQFVLVNYIPAVTGLAGMVVAIARSQGEARLQWVVWFALSAATFIVAGLRIGYVQSLQLTTCFGSVYLLSCLPVRWAALRIPGAFAMSVIALAVVVPADQATRAEGAASAQCSRPQDAIGLTFLPAGRLLAPIDEGAYLLALTQHQIVAGPYHRNNDGNRVEAEAFSLPAGDALQLLRAHRVDYVAICGRERRNAPLVKALMDGTPGATRLEAAGAYQVWRIDP